MYAAAHPKAAVLSIAAGPTGEEEEKWKIEVTKITHFPSESSPERMNGDDPEKTFFFFFYITYIMTHI